MTKTYFEDYICRYFCDYYKAGDKEDQACQGALQVDNLVRRGRIAIENFPHGSFEIPPAVHDPQLDARICAGCPFREKDCDFQAIPQIIDSLPCGGYRLLTLLMQQHVLSAEDLPTATHG